MKTLLVGGPRDGEVIDVHRTVFGTGEITEIYGKGDILKSRIEDKYLSRDGICGVDYKVKHPAKKRGYIRVFDYQGKFDRTNDED
jgi:hypothetical protein